MGLGAGITQSAPLGTSGAAQVTEHVPDAHERSESQVEPQQGCPSAPQATHVPFEQVAPDAQTSFAQQMEAFAPQLTHIAFTHIDMAELHESPGQQCVFTSPHCGPTRCPPFPSTPPVPIMVGKPAPPIVDPPPCPMGGPPPMSTDEPPPDTVPLPPMFGAPP
jgi:hypothetical protein